MVVLSPFFRYTFLIYSVPFGRGDGVSEPEKTKEQLVRELAESEQRFRLAFEKSPLGMIFGGPGGVCTKVNAALCRMLGYAEGELDGANVLDITYPEDREETRSRVNDVTAGGSGGYQIEKRYVSKDGRPVWVYVTTAAVHDPAGQLLYVLVMVEDISERKRSEELLRTQYELALDLSRISDLSEALRICLRAAMHVSGTEAGTIHWLLDNGDKALAARAGLSDEFCAALQSVRPPPDVHRTILEHRPVFTNFEELPSELQELHLREGLRGVAALPVAHEGRTIAVLSVVSRRTDEVPVCVRDGLELVAAQIGGAIARVEAGEAVKQERELLRDLLDVYEKHREVISHEIHDRIAQPLTGAKMHLEAASLRLRKDVPEPPPGLAKAVELLGVGIKEARRLMQELRPHALDEYGLLAAVDTLIAEAKQDKGPAIELDVQVRFARLLPPLETAVFRIVQEALFNALRHSKSARIRVELKQHGDRLHIDVQDWGVGFDPQSVSKKCFGLRGLCTRARLYGGQAAIQSGPGQGTRVHAELHVAEPPPGEVR